MPIEALVLLGLITLNGVFAMSEIALVTARRARLQVLVEEGDRGAAAAMALNTEPTRFLSTIQVGITSIGITSGHRRRGRVRNAFEPVADRAWCETR